MKSVLALMAVLSGCTSVDQFCDPVCTGESICTENVCISAYNRTYRVTIEDVEPATTRSGAPQLVGVTIDGVKESGGVGTAMDAYITPETAIHAQVGELFTCDFELDVPTLQAAYVDCRYVSYYLRLGLEPSSGPR